MKKLRVLVAAAAACGGVAGDDSAADDEVCSVLTANKVTPTVNGAAYNAGTGYPNSSGQNGCLDGH